MRYTCALLVVSATVLGMVSSVAAQEVRPRCECAIAEQPRFTAVMPDRRLPDLSALRSWPRAPRPRAPRPATPRAPRAAGSEPLRYARLGYGAVFGDRMYGTPALGFGYRAELDSIAVDVSFNLQSAFHDAGAQRALGVSWIRLAGLHFLDPDAQQSAYVGGGLSLGTTTFGRREGDWIGTGLQAEVTAGYELARRSTIRVFIEATGGLPLYRVSRHDVVPGTRAGMATDERYAPFATVSLGVGF